jgi:hypothetical protein
VQIRLHEPARSKVRYAASFLPDARLIVDPRGRAGSSGVYELVGDALNVDGMVGIAHAAIGTSFPAIACTQRSTTRTIRPPWFT